MGAVSAKRAIVLMDGRLPPEAHLVAFVHNECVLECPSDMTEDISEIIRACMLEAGAEVLKGKVDTIVEIVVNDCWQK